MILWQSESGPLQVREAGIDNFLLMAKRIVTDMRELKPVVWCDWQYMENGIGSVWALVGYNSKTKIYERTKGFYCRKQFSHFIKKGYTFIESTNNNSLTAISPNGKELVIVLVNQDSTAKSYTLKINGMKIKGINCYRTSETEDFVSIQQNIKSDQACLTVELKNKSVTSFIFKVK